MTGLEIALSVAVVFLLVVCVISLRYNIKHGILLLEMTGAIEDALDLLDERYKSINDVLEIPLFFDSPQIRQVLTDIEASRDAILQVANYVTVVDNPVEDVELVEQ